MSQKLSEHPVGQAFLARCERAINAANLTSEAVELLGRNIDIGERMVGSVIVTCATPLPQGMEPDDRACG